MIFLCGFAAPALAADILTVHSAQAARSDWAAQTPPADVWEDVAIPDDWNKRWPGFDGVVWYRIEWDQPEPLEPVGLDLEYINMAGAVFVNGTPIARDANLVEPLSRSWNLPRHWLLAPPLLRAGRNTLLVRVSGFAAYQPGIGVVQIGSAERVRETFARQNFWRRTLKIFTLAMNATLGAFFVVLWLLRRREVAFGWYGLTTLLWFVYTSNQVLVSPWPFASTHTYQSVAACLFVAFAASFTMFVLRFCERRYPRAEAAMWIAAALACAWMLLTPPPGVPLPRALLFLGAAGTAIAASGLLIVFALRSRQPEQLMLAVPALAYFVSGIHDLLYVLALLPGNFAYSDITAPVTTLAFAGVMAWRYARNVRRVENFNVELHSEVEAARDELAGNLQRQHDIEMTHARIGERLNLVRDLHDGLGGTLTGSIAAIENAPQNLTVPQLLGVLKEVRDDLRLIIDTSTQRQEGAQSLGEQLVALRHRMSRLLDTAGIECRWDISGVDDLHLQPSRALDVLRFLQEALTNVYKHSGASAADVVVRNTGGRLHIEVRDDGRGFRAEPGLGAGLPSMQARARRLGGELAVDSTPGATRLAVEAAV